MPEVGHNTPLLSRFNLTQNAVLDVLSALLAPFKSILALAVGQRKLLNLRSIAVEAGCGMHLEAVHQFEAIDHVF